MTGSAGDRSVDVVVAGSGAAAMAAAATALASGAQVAVLEKAEQLGGTTAKSGGSTWVPNNSFLLARGLEDPRPDALRFMARQSFPALYDPDAPNLGLPELAYRLIGTFFDHAGPAIDALADMGALQCMMEPRFGEMVDGVDWAKPDYHAEFADNRVPNGRILMPDFDLETAQLGGAVMIEQMRQFVAREGGTMQTATRVVGLLTEDGAVRGVEVESGGKRSAIHARQGVIFGTGGFTHDPFKLLAHLRGPIFGGCAVPTNTGDFLDLASELGAELGNLSNGYYSQNVLERTIAQGGVLGHDEDVFIPFGDSMLIVNKYGDRVGCEKTPYHERTQSHFVYDHVRCEYPNLIQFMVWDDAVASYDREHFLRYPVPEPGATSPWVIEGNTWEELAAKIQQRLLGLEGARGLTAAIGPSARLAPDFTAHLRGAVQRFNRFAETGHDLDFGRGDAPIHLAWGSAPRDDGRANPTMRPFASSGPYYCCLLGAGTLDTCGGPVIDERSRILRRGGQPIDGLYGAGNCVAAPTGQAYWGAGSTLGPGLTFGHLAAKDAVQRSPRT